jgi:hypothetical protein
MRDAWSVTELLTGDDAPGGLHAMRDALTGQIERVSRFRCLPSLLKGAVA